MQFRLSSIYVCQSSIRPHWGVQSVKSLVDWKPPSDFLKGPRNLIWIKWQTTTARGTNAPNSAWPDVDIKSSPSRPNSSHSSFDVKIPFFIKAAKIVKYLGYFCTKNCHQSPYNFGLRKICFFGFFLSNLIKNCCIFSTSNYTDFHQSCGSNFLSTRTILHWYCAWGMIDA